MRTPFEVDRVLALRRLGFNHSSIARKTGISRTAIRDWCNGKLPDFDNRPTGKCEQRCGERYNGSITDYVYLFGLYLGDGNIASHPRDVFRLRITCDNAYPAIMDRCEVAMASVMPSSSVGRMSKIGCTDVNSYSKHWPCLFPQHGPGKKHDREIKLEPWQQALVDVDPRPLVEGLIHSDGCRVLNWVNGTPYPRYHFSQRSDDIKRIFTDALDQLGIEWRHNNAMNVSIARRQSVATLDEFVMPKA